MHARFALGFCLALSLLVTGSLLAVDQPLATGKPKFLGSAYSAPQTTNFAAYWNQVTPENAGKWGSVENTRDVMNWTELDASYNFAKSNGFVFRYHILVWGNQQPSWIESLPPAEQLEEINEWFAAVAARYPAIDYLEVVNEPLHDPPNGATNGNYYNALGGAGASGWEWILNAFRMARPLFPNAQLVLNEYSVTNDGNQMANYVGIVNLLKAEDLIDVVAVQAHAFSTTVSATTTTNNLNTLAATGIPIMVTELDIDGPTDQQQLTNYERIFPAFWEHPSVIGITLWGWRPGLWRPTANLIRADNTERPALEWLRTYVPASNPPLRTRVAADPVDVSVEVQDDAVFTVATTGNPAPTVQWQVSANQGDTWTGVVDDATFSGATTATLTVNDATIALDGRRFRAVATNAHGTATSAAANLEVTKKSLTLTFEGLVQDYTGDPLSPVALTPLSGVSVDINYTFNGSVTVPSATGAYTVVATVDDPVFAGTASATFEIRPVLTMGGAPARDVAAGGTTTLAATFSASSPPSFQWQFQPAGGGSWSDVPGATTATYAIRSMQRFLAGSYRVIATSNGASAASAAVVVTPTAAPTSDARLLNMSTRALCQTGDNVLIPGFVIGGTGTKRLLIRAVGPTLDDPPINFGGGTLPNPRMTLRKRNFVTQTDDIIAANDDWETNANAAEIAVTTTALSAFDLTQSEDAALLLDLAPGQYTVVTDDPAAASGIAIVELYDADEDDATANLLNISNRGYVGVGAQVMIPGFVISQEGPKTLLVRVVGPTLAGYGVPGTMADPRLAVFDASSTAILTQDNWQDSPDAAYTQQVAAQVSAFALTAGSTDAAFVVTLAPGAYTVVGSAADGVSTGVVLVELYVVN